MKDGARTFAYICFGLMCLVLAGRAMVSSSAHADINPAGSIHGLEPSSNAVLTTSGEVWQYNTNSWFRLEDLDPPIPVSDIAMWGGYGLVSSTGDVWVHPSPGGGSWINIGPPGGAVRAQEASWGEVKAKYGDN